MKVDNTSIRTLEKHCINKTWWDVWQTKAGAKLDGVEPIESQSKKSNKSVIIIGMKNGEKTTASKRCATALGTYWLIWMNYLKQNMLNVQLKIL